MLIEHPAAPPGPSLGLKERRNGKATYLFINFVSAPKARTTVKPSSISLNPLNRGLRFTLSILRRLRLVARYLVVNIKNAYPMTDAGRRNPGKIEATITMAPTSIAALPSTVFKLCAKELSIVSTSLRRRALSVSVCLIRLFHILTLRND